MDGHELQPISTFERCQSQVAELNELKTRLERLKTEQNTLQTKYEAKLQQWHAQVAVICQEQDEKEVNLANASTEWLQIKTKLESSVMSPKQKVILNVGGSRFETTIDTLTKYDTQTCAFFKNMFSQQWELEKDPADGSIFIDRDGYLFGFILQYLRTGSLIIDPKHDLLRCDLITEATFYSLPGLVELLQSGQTAKKTSMTPEPQSNLKGYYLHTKILSADQQTQLNRLFGSESQQWQLLYSASRDGYAAKAFHTACDDRNPTMTIIRSKNGWIFGGFTSIAWSSKKQSLADPYAFLFTLKNPHGIPPTKYAISEARVGSAVSHTTTDGPTFGSVQKGGVDLLLANPFDAPVSRTFFPQTYRDTTKKERFTFTGNPYFACDEVEVFSPV